jgi:hypothetical protein
MLALASLLYEKGRLTWRTLGVSNLKQVSMMRDQTWDGLAGASPAEVLAKAKRMAEQVKKAQQRSASRRAVIEQSRLRRHRKWVQSAPQTD